MPRFIVGAWLVGAWLIGAWLIVFSSLSIQAATDSIATEVRTTEPSLSLQSLLQRAIQTHPLVDSGRADVRSATQGIKSARWQYFPTPGVSYQRAFADNDDPSFHGDD